MKLVKNCIKTCQFCNEYQSILSDVDKHQRDWEKNPNKHQALTLNDADDENKFLSNFGNDISGSNNLEGRDEHKDDESEESESEESEDLKAPKKELEAPAIQYTNGDSDEEEEEEEEEKEYHGEHNPAEVRTTKVEVLQKSSQNSLPRGSEAVDLIDDSLRILPHFHKHDLHKMSVYDKPSYWIWGGYFTEIGCLNTFNCQFKNIDYEFPHYQCHDCEFQVCLEWADYYSQSTNKVKFIHRTYNPVFHQHPVKLDLGSETKSWVWSGVSLPNKCLSTTSDKPLTNEK